jgi:hypothetical protein
MTDDIIDPLTSPITVANTNKHAPKVEQTRRNILQGKTQLENENANFETKKVCLINLTKVATAMNLELQLISNYHNKTRSVHHHFG